MMHAQTQGYYQEYGFNGIHLLLVNEDVSIKELALIIKNIVDYQGEVKFNLSLIILLNQNVC